MPRFSIDLTELSDERALVPAGEYNMLLTKAELNTGKVKDSDPERHWASANLTFVIKDEEVSKLLHNDEPKIFANFYVNLDDNNQLIMTNNPELGSLLTIADLKTKEASEMFSADITDDMDDFKAVCTFVKNALEALVGTEVLGKVVHRPRTKGSDEMVANVTKFAKPV